MPFRKNRPNDTAYSNYLRWVQTLHHFIKNLQAGRIRTARQANYAVALCLKAIAYIEQPGTTEDQRSRIWRIGFVRKELEGFITQLSSLSSELPDQLSQAQMEEKNNAIRAMQKLVDKPKAPALSGLRRGAAA